MNHTLVPVTNKKQLQSFVEFPLTLYQGNPWFVPPLTRDELETLDETVNPAFDSCKSRLWLVYRGRQLAGRIAGIHYKKVGNPYQNIMRFGWMDFVNDTDTVSLLLQQVENWARRLGLQAVQGPIGFTNFDHAGFLVDGFQERATASASYNYPYYGDAIEKAGYVRDAEWVEYKIRIPPTVPDKIIKLASIVQRRLNVSSVVPRSKREMIFYARSIFELLNAAYSHLYGVVPMTEKQIDYYTRKYLPLMRRDYITLVVNETGQLIAFGIAMPSLARALQSAWGKLFPWGLLHIFKSLHRNTEAELLLVAVHPNYQGKGVNALLMKEMHQGFIRQHIGVAESNPELDDNQRVQSMWSYYDAHMHKRRRCYIKYLDSAPRNLST